MQANGRTSQRSYDRDDRRDAGTLLGKLVRYKSSEGGPWDGLSLKSDPTTSPKPRSAAYWRDFLGGRRTLDPSYPRTEEHRGKRIPAERHSSCILSEGAMLASQSSEVFSHRTKAVMLNGLIRDDHKTSQENTLSHATAASDTKAALKRRGSESSLHTYASQITNLPGTVYRVQPRNVKVAKHRTDSMSKIATLPGPKDAAFYAPQVAYPDKDLHQHMKKYVRCTHTTREIEEIRGVLPIKTGPRLSLMPTSASSLPTYRLAGVEEEGRKIRFVCKEQYRSSEEVDYNKGVRGRGKNPLCVSLKLI